MALNIPKPSAASAADAPAPTVSPIKRRITGASVSLSSSPAPNYKFVEAKPSTRTPRLVIEAAGIFKSGKSHFGFTAPAPIYQHSFDIGNEGVIDKFLLKKKIYVAEYELTVQPGEASDQEVADAASLVWDQFVSNFRDGLASCGNGTSVIDTSTEMWELLRLARLGKLLQVPAIFYARINKEMRTLLREVYNHNGNTIFLSQSKPVWEQYKGTDGKDKSRKTGEYERTGFNELPSQVQVVSTCRRVDREGGGSDFEMEINDCRVQPDINGMVIENDFDVLMSMVFMGS